MPTKKVKGPEDKEAIAFNRCETTYPKLAYGRCCKSCLSKWKITPATQIHHIIPRSCLHLRFHLLNLYEVCGECHRKIHDGKLTESISDQQREWLQKQSNRDFKAILLARGQTKEEFYKEQLQDLKSVLLI